MWVKAARTGPAALHLGTSGAYKVWLDGQLVGEGDTYRTPTPLQESHALTLRAGWNRLLVKLGSDEGMWGFYARLSAPDGAPLPGLVASVQPPAEPSAAPAAKVHDSKAMSSAPGAKVHDPKAMSSAPGAKAREPSAAPVAPKRARSLRALLAERGEQPRARPADKLALAEFYRWTLPFAAQDRTAVDAARAADDAAKTARSAQLLATLDPDQNTSRAALQSAVERARAEGAAGAPLLATLLVELSLRDRYLGLESRARALLDEAFRTAPDDVLIELALAERLGADGFPLDSLAWVEDMQRRYPGSGLLAR